MKKTKYIMLISAGLAGGREQWRRVWEDEQGNYFVKVDGESRNVNHARAYFVEG